VKEDNTSDSTHQSDDSPETTMGSRIQVRHVPSPGRIASLRVWHSGEASMFANSEGAEGNASARMSAGPSADETRSAYEINSLIGRGGMGEVYSATQTSLGRTVAVKRIARHRTTGTDEALRDAIAAFHSEAVIAGRLEHPNIVPIHDLGLDELGMPLLAMKLIEGSSWDQLLTNDLATQEPSVVIAMHMPILIAVGQAVAFAHSRDIVHRDIKPAQVLVGEFGEVLLADWGLAIHAPSATAKVTESPHADVPSRASASSPAGTPVMMAPEQTEPTAKNLGTWTDIYLLGGTLYYILTGQYPHDASSRAAAMELARIGEVTPPSKRKPGRMIPAELESLAMECLRPKPSDRLASATEFVRRLQAFLNGETRRRESILLTREIEAEGKIPAGNYQAFGERVATLERALALWEGNADAARLRTEAIEGYARAAFEHSDFTLSRAMAGRLETGPRRDELIAQATAAEEHLRSQLQSRRVAIAAAFILMFVVLVGGGYSIQTIRKERDAEEASRKLADARRQEAERNLAIAKMQGDGANELVVICVGRTQIQVGRVPHPGSWHRPGRRERSLARRFASGGKAHLRLLCRAGRVRMASRVAGGICGTSRHRG
jgi:serine/threonine protein kinase